MITFRFSGNGDTLHIRAYGKTFPAREAFKAASYTWEPSDAQWAKDVAGADAIKAEALWIKSSFPTGSYEVLRESK